LNFQAGELGDVPLCTQELQIPGIRLDLIFSAFTLLIKEEDACTLKEMN